QSGHLAARHEVEALDCIASDIGFEECRRRVLAGGYEALVFVTGFVSWREDMPFLADLAREADLWTAGSGDVLLHRGDRVREAYPSPALAGWLEAPRPGARLGGAEGRWVRMPRPRHELFPRTRYHLPQLRTHPYASLLIGFGCPYRCRFCPFEKLPYRL